MPLPTYVIDSVEYYPSDYLLFPDSVESGNNMKEAFLTRYRRIAAAYNESPSTNIINQEYEGYLSGEYGVCLKTVTPETIFLKGFVMARIEELFENPKPLDETWRSKLRGLVNRLYGLERQFAPCDTGRFGSLRSRVRYIDRARKEYPEAFA